MERDHPGRGSAVKVLDNPDNHNNRVREGRRVGKEVAGKRGRKKEEASVEKDSGVRGTRGRASTAERSDTRPRNVGADPRT